jgi:membrane-bound ClpP family serine protease
MFNPFILVLLGLLLIVIEFFLPGMVMGVLGAIAILASIILFAIQQTSSSSLLWRLA